MEEVKDFKYLKDIEFDCEKCNNKFYIKSFQNYVIFKRGIEFYTKRCSKCRRFYKKCEECNTEFYTKCNSRSCSKYCADVLREKSYIKSCNAKHNFSKNSKSRLKFEKELFENEGVINNFQRKEIINVIQEKRNGKIDIIKEKQKLTINLKLQNDPLFYKKRAEKSKLTKKKNGTLNNTLKAIGKSSKESLKVFDPLIDFIIKKTNIKLEDIYIGTNNKNEYFLSNGNHIFYLYDFTILSKKLIIEYNGIAWHPNPNWNKNLLNEWKHPFTKETSEEIMSKNNKKIEFATNKGFKVLQIWNDINLKENIKICKKFILNNI